MLRTRSTDSLQLERIQQRTDGQVANTRLQPTVNPVEVKQPKIFKMTTQREHSLGQERSQVNKQVEGQDHQDESAVKENPTIQIDTGSPNSRRKAN